MGAAGIGSVGRERIARDGRRVVPAVRLAIVVALAAQLGACGRQPSGTAAEPRDTTVVGPGATTPEDTTTWILRDALGPPVGDGDPLVREMRPHLGEWVRLWRRASPGFELPRLVKGRVGRFRPERSSVDPAEWSRGEGAPVRGFDFVLAPDSSRAIDPDWYAAISGGAIERDVDSCPVVYDLRERRAHWLGTVGTCCRTDGAFWIDAHRFVVWGFEESMAPEPLRHRGVLRVFDLRDSTQARYYTPEVGEPGLDAYRQAFESWALEHAGRVARAVR
jgi:hypothetical protein